MLLPSCRMLDDHHHHHQISGVSKGGAIYNAGQMSVFGEDAQFGSLSAAVRHPESPLRATCADAFARPTSTTVADNGVLDARGGSSWSQRLRVFLVGEGDRPVGPLGSLPDGNISRDTRIRASVLDGIFRWSTVDVPHGFDLCTNLIGVAFGSLQQGPEGNRHEDHEDPPATVFGVLMPASGSRRGSLQCILFAQRLPPTPSSGSDSAPPTPPWSLSPFGLQRLPEYQHSFAQTYPNLGVNTHVRLVRARALSGMVASAPFMCRDLR